MYLYLFNALRSLCSSLIITTTKVYILLLQLWLVPLFCSCTALWDSRPFSPQTSWLVIVAKAQVLPVTLRMVLFYSGVPVSRDVVTEPPCTNLKPKRLNGTGPSLVLLFTPVLFLLWHVNTCSVERPKVNQQAHSGNKLIRGFSIQIHCFDTRFKIPWKHTCVSIVYVKGQTRNMQWVEITNLKTVCLMFRWWFSFKWLGDPLNNSSIRCFRLV